jgi:bacterioferritin
LIELLNEDRAREYQASSPMLSCSQSNKGAEHTEIAKELEQHAAEELSHALKIAKYVDYLSGKPVTTPKQVAAPEDAIDMLQGKL